MNQDESIALWRRGKDAWNAWAEDMLRQKAELQNAGTWNGDKPPYEWSDETRKWNEAAQTDLSGLRFMTRALADTAEKQAVQPEEGSRPADADGKTLIIEGDGIKFNGFVFPWLANFIGARFHGEAAFIGARFHGEAAFQDVLFHETAIFAGARFHELATFETVEFHEGAFFMGARFREVAHFLDVKFRGKANFQDARFRGGADFVAVFQGQADFGRAQFRVHAGFGRVQFRGRAGFREVQFQGQADFGRVEFQGGADFRRVQFHREADFRKVQFQGQAQFASANFERSASFRDALFGSKAEPQFADFTAIKADRRFDLSRTQFSKVPAFNQADFKQAPDLDNVSFPARPFWHGGDTGLVPQYRALKRLAVQGHDYESEQMAFKGELRSRRWVMDKWYGPSVWFGMGYDFFADCGRSIWRPFVTWAALVLGFAAFYFSRAADSLAARCGSPETPALQALYLSIKNGLVLFGGTRDARINQAYLCLYGGDANQAAIPLSVTYIETLAQTPISAVLLFLFLLAVRNQFKIK